MNWTTKLPFTLEGIDGELEIVYTPLGQKLYQNNTELKKIGSGFGGMNYNVRTSTGETETIKVVGNLLKGREINYREKKISLENALSGLQILLSLLPAISLVAFLGLFGGSIGILGGALLGALVALGMMMVGNMIRNEKNVGSQIVTSLLVSVGCVAIYLVFSLVMAMITGAAFLFFFR